MTERPNLPALVTKLESPTVSDAPRLTGWLVKLMLCGAKFSGYWSSEILPPSVESKGWTLVERFLTNEQANAYRESDARRQLLGDISASLRDAIVSEEVSTGAPAPGSVGTAIVTEVRPGMEDEYLAWEEKIQNAQAKFPGYRGNYFQPPAPGTQGKWMSLVRFDTPHSLQKWFASEERKEIVKQAGKFVTSTQFQTMASSFPGWFPTDTEGKPPPNWKTSMLVLLGLFPTVMLEIRFLSPLMSGLPLSPGTFVGNVLSVAVTTWITMPVFIFAFRWWLLPKKDSVGKINLYGTIILILLFLGEILALWNLVKGAGSY